MNQRNPQSEIHHPVIQPETAVVDVAQRPADYKIAQVIAASAVGTMIERYDFYIFGSLATVILSCHNSFS